jgi:hypothetical protein
MELQLKALLTRVPQEALRAKRARAEELARLVDNLVEAIASGEFRASPAQARRLNEAEAELTQLRLSLVERKPVNQFVGLETRLRTAVSGLPKLLEKEPEKARAALREILGPRSSLGPPTTGGT